MPDQPALESGCYRIVVRGEIRAEFLVDLPGLSVESMGPESILALVPPSRKELQAALRWLGDAGIEVVAITRLDGD